MNNEQKPVNREYKDRLFKRVFSDKKDLLDLYNAVNGTAYDNPDELVINTLEDAIYMGMKNDLSFIITDELNLYEHQSTFNPNMPLRGLVYIVAQYKSIADKHDVYGSKLINLPLPKNIVFYNGLKSEPDRFELLLSDAYAGERKEEACLEFKTTMININWGQNGELMGKCGKLKDFSLLVYIFRENLKSGMELKEAARKTVERCIDEGVLAELLQKNRAEVMDMILTEYDEEKHIANERQIAREEGVADGIRQGIEQGENRKLKKLIIKKLDKKKSVQQIADELEESVETIEEIIKGMSE